MPHLYGQPYEYELRRKIAGLQEELVVERLDHRRTKRSLIIANAEIAELKDKMRRMTELANEIVGESDRNIDTAIHERYLSERKKAFAL